MWGSSSPSLEYWATTFPLAGVPDHTKKVHSVLVVVGIAGGKDHFGHIEPDGKDRGVQRPTGCRHLFGEAGFDIVLPTSKVGIGVGGHFGRT